MTMGERLFKRNYRLDRNNFMNLLRQITPLIEFQGNNSSHECGDGCDLHIDQYIQLAVARRLLAGGSYLDISFAYDVGLSSIYPIFWRVMEAIDEKVDNIKFDFTSEGALRQLEETFLKISKGVLGELWLLVMELFLKR